MRLAPSASAPSDVDAPLTACSPVTVALGPNPGTPAPALDDNHADLATALARALGITGDPYTALGP